MRTINTDLENWNFLSIILSSFENFYSSPVFHWLHHKCPLGCYGFLFFFEKSCDQKLNGWDMIPIICTKKKFNSPRLPYFISAIMRSKFENLKILQWIWKKIIFEQFENFSCLKIIFCFHHNTCHFTSTSI